MHESRLGVVLTGVGALVAVALVGSVSESAAQRSQPSGEIAYVATKSRIYVVNADGTGRRLLLTGVAMDTFNWSPDGALIAYTAGPWSDEFPPTVIRIARTDGTVLRTLPRVGLDSAYEPTWSPDGARLAFGGWKERDDSYAIYSMRADGTGLRRVTSPVYPLLDESPEWSPDGRWIVFERIGRTAWTDVMVVRPDGRRLHRIARVLTGNQCACPDWSPDGSKITYQASPNVATLRFPEIFVMNANGTDRRQLTHDRSRDENPDWSPDGQWIAFYSERRGNGEIYVIRADRSALERITRDRWYSMYPRWRPGG